MNSTALSFQSSVFPSYDQSLFLDELFPPAEPLAWTQEDLYPMQPWQHNLQVPCWEWEFKDFDDIWGDFGMWAQQDINQSSFFDEKAVVEVDAEPLVSFPGEAAFESSSAETFHHQNDQRCMKSSSGLQFDEIRKYFDVPISKAAKELKVGLTVLKKRCRELNIRRWPHRKIKSLKFLIQNAKDLGLTNEVAMLEEHQRMLHRIPEMELTERTKKLRQACFKANYKKRRALAMAAADSSQS